MDLRLGGRAAKDTIATIPRGEHPFHVRGNRAAASRDLAIAAAALDLATGRRTDSAGEDS